MNPTNMPHIIHLDKLGLEVRLVFPKDSGQVVPAAAPETQEEPLNDFVQVPIAAVGSAKLILLLILFF